MSQNKLNVLVYAGNGSTIESVRHTLWSLRRLLSQNYAVIPVSSEALLREPWTSSCAMFVMPGGADLGYCRTLNGPGNRLLSDYVNRGGAYLGLCAGGYYASSRCEFEVGHPELEVAGDRELAFYPGTCRGCAFKGFIYHSEAGARAARLVVNGESLIKTVSGSELPGTFRSYYNGGGVFVDAAKYKDQGVEILASYHDELDVASGDGAAAVVYRKIGQGAALLTGPHPEFAAANLTKPNTNPHYPEILDALSSDDKMRVTFLKACLSKLGLAVSSDDAGVPSLSRLHLASADVTQVARIDKSWSGVLVTRDGQDHLEGENDTFCIERPGSFVMKEIKEALPDAGEAGDTALPAETLTDEKIVDYDTVVKRLVVHDSTLPGTKETPCFNLHAFFASLSEYQQQLHKESSGSFGKCIIYGEVVTSTSTMLDKNPKLIRHLPSGLTVTATTQLAGRGRGSNVWVSPPGALMYSTIIRHSLSQSKVAPVVFVQYLAALAVVTGIKYYDEGYDALPIRLKWPNDVYALDPSTTNHREDESSESPMSEQQRAKYVKISGVLINSSYNPGNSSAGEEGGYTVVAGVGVNVANSVPTTSLNRILARHFPKLQPFTVEKLLASILVNFESLYTHFCAQGFSEDILKVYYKYWLHAGQIVTLEPTEQEPGQRRARIKGITPDWGLLVAEELVGDDDRATGKTWELQSDSNSFDFFKGLLRKKR